MASNGTTAFLLSVGDELLSGTTVDTNSAYLSSELASAGVAVVGHATVGDDQPTIEEAIRDAAAKCDLLVISGGIGPTPDDLTREALAAVMSVGLVEDESWVAHVEEMFRHRGREMKPGNRKQAGVPEGGELLWNPAGTAAGVRAGVGDCTVFVVPGVPREMKAMAEKHLLPWIRRNAAEGGRVLKRRAVHTFGIGESDLAARLADLLKRGKADDDLKVGTTANHGVVSVRAYATAASEPEALAALDSVEKAVRDELGDLVFGVDDETLPEAVARCLRDHPRQPIVSLAESCTGGLIAAMLTDVPGSSAHFHRGFVTYSNEAKTQLLGVPADLIAQHGAVSGEVVRAMATAARSSEGHGIALSVSGVAGPGGGTDDKPVGTVWIALCAPGKNADPADPYVFAKRFNFPGDRETVRQRAAYAALTMLRFHLLGRDLDKLPF